MIQVFGNAVHWGNQKQKCMAISSTEVEFIALAEAAVEVLLIKLDNVAELSKVSYLKELPMVALFRIVIIAALQR